MYNYAEAKLCQAIGSWSTAGQLLLQNTSGVSGRSRETIDLTAGSVSQDIFPGQCQAFLTSDEKFIWWVEQWEVSREVDLAIAPSPINLVNKKVYPAKVNGISLALPNFLNINSDPNLAVTVRWRDELITHGNYPSSQWYPVPSYRPGFGEVILEDLERPVRTNTVQCNNLGILEVGSRAFQAGRPFEGPLGRLMSMASYVDPDLAKAYDASNNKKKKKSPNEQDYQQMPEYPPYTPYQDNSGY